MIPLATHKYKVPMRHRFYLSSNGEMVDHHRLTPTRKSHATHVATPKIYGMHLSPSWVNCRLTTQGPSRHHTGHETTPRHHAWSGAAAAGLLRVSTGRRSSAAVRVAAAPAKLQLQVAAFALMFFVSPALLPLMMSYEILRLINAIHQLKAINERGIGRDQYKHYVYSARRQPPTP